MNTLKQNHLFLFPDVPVWMPRAIIIASVVIAHVAIIVIWSNHAEYKLDYRKDLTVNFAIANQISQPATVQPPKVTPVAIQKQASEMPLPVAVQQDETQVKAPEIPATEPDYKAAYLNNPPPAYPMVARRMGMQGRVVLNVEVLAGGICGQVSIHQSSGFTVLDNAAIQSVKNWHFSPASVAGRAVDKWFMIPIQFSLKDTTA